MSQAKTVVGMAPTPNPATLKFYVDQPICASVVNFLSPEDAKDTPLVRALFQLPEVKGVMVRHDVISVSKSETASWTDVSEVTAWQSLSERVKTIIDECLSQGQGDISVPELTQEQQVAGDEMTQRISQIINDEIRPAVAMDGGDITFDRYDRGVVYLHLKGACSGCPSSVITLKMGIENRLKEEIPGIKEVVAV